MNGCSSGSRPAYQGASLIRLLRQTKLRKIAAFDPVCQIAQPAGQFIGLHRQHVADERGNAGVRNLCARNPENLYLIRAIREIVSRCKSQEHLHPNLLSVSLLPCSKMVMSLADRSR